MSASIRDVAERAGVSVGTVSNVLNHRERVAPESVRRVNEAIAALGYVRNDAARQLRAGRSTTVGLVVLDVRNPFFTEIARGAEREADKHGLSVILANSDEDVAREARYLDLFEQQRVRGILISPYQQVGSRLRELRDRGMPAVLVDRRSEDDRFSSVSVDDERGGYLAARHLLDSGRRRLLYTGGPLDMRQIDDRRQGARRAVDETEGASLEILPATASQVAEGRVAGDEIASRPAAHRPDAVFCANDLVALGVLQSLAAHGIRVPDDIALVGFDDIDFAAAAVVPLTSVRQPSLVMGETALRILVDESDDRSRPAEQVVFEPELVVRASTGG
ncbi:LacI family DNA-binding transcriptional regulator [Microbacterium sp. SSM24]|uniref:LacI family DNA-binding transcriptional regulator n=1 Tax=Microbacterium sp. SSM24 TaxID=2991714 RepID=UPI00222714A1|nr:LacI family DNA-binding transcriptional regulator [Microbacterium sp. SSM24]MCW3493259.1 LacI family transcriptional regulator [Microbacterium sp. SSM24]